MITDSLLTQFEEFSLKEEQNNKTLGGAAFPVHTSTGIFAEVYDDTGYLYTLTPAGGVISQEQLDANEDCGALRPLCDY
jgi:hypothetical protein